MYIVINYNNKNNIFIIMLVNPTYAYYKIMYIYSIKIKIKINM